MSGKEQALVKLPFDNSTVASAAIAGPAELESAYTRDLESAFRIARQVQVGGIHVN